MLQTMAAEFQQIVWDCSLETDLKAIMALAIAEDLYAHGDLTSQALLTEGIAGRAAVVARKLGKAAGFAGVPLILHSIHPGLTWSPVIKDGETINPNECAGIIAGPAHAILAAERILLNFLGRLSGIATLTSQYVEAVAGTNVRIYDTRKTIPGWRRLEKYAVRCGGGWNHRSGLYDAVLIKDNHLALGSSSAERNRRFTPVGAVLAARKFTTDQLDQPEVVVEIEVDSIEQLNAVLPVGPDIVLLDNMTPAQLKAAVALRNAIAPTVVLEASGGIDLNSVRQVAETGVDRISIGALTHSAPALDIGLDWLK